MKLQRRHPGFSQGKRAISRPLGGKRQRALAEACRSQKSRLLFKAPPAASVDMFSSHSTNRHLLVKNASENHPNVAIVIPKFKLLIVPSKSHLERRETFHPDHRPRAKLNPFGKGGFCRLFKMGPFHLLKISSSQNAQLQKPTIDKPSHISHRT